jgi:hypothetical protein
MNLEGRKNNIYFDKTGKQILVGDLLKVYHFGKGNRTQYMYHVAVMEETKDFPVMAFRCYTKEKPHYRAYVVCDNEQRVYHESKIINMHDWRTKRQRLRLK